MLQAALHKSQIDCDILALITMPCRMAGNVAAARSPFQGRVAQLAEHSTLNRQVEGSIPSASTI